METFLATVDTVYPTNKEFDPYDTVIVSGSTSIDDTVSVYNENRNFSDLDASLYGAITYRYEDSTSQNLVARPFDRNNFTFPIKGETVVILKMFGAYSQTFWLPYTNTPYPNYRKDYTSNKNTKSDSSSDKGNGLDPTKVSTAGGITKTSKPKDDDIGYKINEKIKFLKPKNGDTILSGRVGNTIRLSELFLSSDGKSHPGIFIRNKQNPELDSKKIGETVDEDINKDGSSVYFVSGKIKVPFKETISKSKKAFAGYPSDFSGDQLFVNSDRIILSAKAKEFIIFGKGNTGIITDGTFSVDAAKPIHLLSSNNVTIESEGGNQIFLNSNNGKIFLGKNQGAGQVDASVQQMVLGGELVAIMQELIDAILNQVYWTPSGPSNYGMPNGPVDPSEFTTIKSKLNKLLSSTNFLSK
jgi:hypothetical protein